MRVVSRPALAAVLCALLVNCPGWSSADAVLPEAEAAGALDDSAELVAQAASVGVAAATLASAADATGVSPAAIVRTLRNNKDAHVTPGGMHFSCSFDNPQYPDEWREPPAPGSLVAEVRAANLPAWTDHLTNANAENVFRLHSRPAARRKIYLAFQGCTTVTTSWNRPDTSRLGFNAIETPPFDWDGDATTFSADERLAILEMWRMVSEDFALWDVDVTTEPLTEAQRARDNEQDDEFGFRCCIGGRSNAWLLTLPTAGGIAPLVPGQSVFGNFLQKDAFVFVQVVSATNDSFWPRAHYLATVISHELGHALGLQHDGFNYRESNGAVVRREYAPGIAAWAPIMGAISMAPTDTSRGFVQWSDMAGYPTFPSFVSVTNTEDDLAIISRGLVPLPDEDGNTLANAQLQNGLFNPQSAPVQLDCPDDPAEFARLCSQPFPDSPAIVRRIYNAVINGANDLDFFSFVARAPGNVTVWLAVVGLFNSNGNVYHRTNLRLNMAFSDPRVGVVREPVSFATTQQRVTAVLPQNANYPARFTFYIGQDHTNLDPTFAPGNGMPSGYGNVGDYSVAVEFVGRDPPPPPPPACDDPDRCSANGACDGCACVSTNEPCVCAEAEGFVPRRDNALGFHCAWNLGSTINNRRLYSARPNSRVRLPWRLGAGGTCNERQVVTSVRIQNGLVNCPATPRTPPRLATAPRGEPVLTEDCNANNGVSYTTFNVGNLSTTRAANRRCRRVTVGTSDGVSHSFFLWVTTD